MKSIASLLAVVCFALLCMIFGLALDLRVLKQDAIKFGYAQYNPTNSHWEWIKK